MTGPSIPTGGLGDCDQSLWTECGWPAVGQQFQAEQASSLDCDISSVGRVVDSGVSIVVPAPSNGKQLFHFATPPLGTLTNHEQFPSHNWGTTKASSQPARSIGYVLDLIHLSIIVDVFPRQNVLTSN